MATVGRRIGSIDGFMGHGGRFGMNNATMRATPALALVLAAAALSGCLGPNYGTGTSAGAQLFGDIDGMLSLGPKARDEIDYAPRAELVRPQNKTVLPPPQEPASAANDPNWPESPEQRSARIRAAADAKGEGTVVTREDLVAAKEGVSDEERARNTWAGSRRNGSSQTVMSAAELNSSREQFRQRLAESKQGSPSTRKYLSEPPLAYRQPAATAPVGDPGVDEDVKARRLKGNKGGLLDKIKTLNPF